MLSLQKGCVPTVLVALESLLVSVLFATSSRPFTVAAVDVPATSESRVNPLATSIVVDNESERNLFELTLPFDFVNDQCERACSSQEEQEEDDDEGPLINACPKVSEQTVVPMSLSIVRYRCPPCPTNRVSRPSTNYKRAIGRDSIMV